MNERIKTIYNRLKKQDYKKLRKTEDFKLPKEIYEEKDLAIRSAKRLLEMVKAETPILFPEDNIGMMRTIKKVPPLLVPQEKETIYSTHYIFDLAQVNNISSDYAGILNEGFSNKKIKINNEIVKYKKDSKQYNELKAMLICIDAVELLAKKYQNEAIKQGKTKLAMAFQNVPMNKPRNFYEALVMLRFINFTLWLNANKHNTLGRFDVYMYPFFKHDIENNIISRDEALEMVSEFFIDLNFDSDLYPGIQQGDNGQSLVLGGVGVDGKEVFNELSDICLDASLDLCLIDPKINIRVGKNTPDDIYYKGTLLTKKGLGFPQYSNDDVVIPALVKWGYDLEDARNYVVAACWEFIIPGVAYDIPNIDALSYPEVTLNVLNEHLLDSETFESLMEHEKKGIQDMCITLANKTKNMFVEPSPFQSIIMTSCIDEAKDICDGAKYNNYGFHGAGLSTATDSLAAVKKLVFDDKKVTKEELLTVLKNNFNGHEKIRQMCISAPKMGNNDDYVDNIAVELTDCFADSLQDLRNERGGIFRPGTGTAMYYIWSSEHLGATPDGRKAGEPFSANYSPSLSVKVNGVLSVIHSFTKPHLERVCNGGPLTLEFHDTLFRNEDGIRKVSQLVKLYINEGGHQLQLNAVNRDTLLDAQKHPEDHKNLIVRVWGWSGYFNELDLEYQNHVIKRLEFV